MENKLNDSVLEAVRNNLPEVTANELKNFIQKSQQLADKLKTAEAEIDRTRIERDKLQKELAAHRSLDEKQQELESKERDLQTRELTLRESTAMNRALIAEAQLKTGMEVMNMVFRNATVNQKVLGTVPVAVDGMPPSQFNSGYGGNVVPSQVSTTTETTQT